MIKFDVHCRLSELHAKFKSDLEVPTASVKSLKLRVKLGRRDLAFSYRQSGKFDKRRAKNGR